MFVQQMLLPTELSSQPELQSLKYCESLEEKELDVADESCITFMLL